MISVPRQRWTFLAAAALLGVSAPAGLAAAAPAAVAAALHCPAANGLFPVNNPRQYVHCGNGVPYLMPCPAGLLWNNAIKVCDWPHPVPKASEDDTFADYPGSGPPGEQPELRAGSRPGQAAVRQASPAGIILGGQVTYTVALITSQPHSAAHLRISYPAGLTWVGGQDCFDDGTGIVDCLAYPAADHFAASAFTLQAGLLTSGPETVTAHFAGSDPASTTAVPDRSLTCIFLTGLIVAC